MIDNKEYWGLDSWQTISPLEARFMMSGAGLNIITPDFIMPKFNLEPFTIDELRQIFNYKRANTSKLRSIIRKAKQATTIKQNILYS